MISVIVINLATMLFARGRWTGPYWLIPVGAVLAPPVSRMLVERAGEAPNGWLR